MWYWLYQWMCRELIGDDCLEGVGFYKYIVKSGSSYSIKKGNERFGTYFRLSDALYERDQLIKADWDWDNLSNLPETENLYEKMMLPAFTHEYSYIYETPQGYKVFKDREYHGKFKSKRRAYDYAEQIGGKVVPVNKRFLVQKSIDGKQRHFGCFKTFEEAKKRRDKLIENGWNE